MKILKKFIKITILLIFSLAALYLTVVKYEKSKLEKDLTSKTDITSQDGIQSLEEWNINGNKQWVSIRGQNKNNPIVLMVHGGPGSTDLYMGRFIDSVTEKHFVVIRWDQRNAGKSFSFLNIGDDFKLETYLSDLHELVTQIKGKFNRKKIYLAGHSWGSILSALTASKYPEDFHAYIGIGQFVNGRDNEIYSYRFTLKEAEKDKNEKAIRELKEIGEPPYNSMQKLGKEREWLGFYGGGLFYGEHRKDMYQHIGNMMMASPEYSLFDIGKFFIGVASSLMKVWPHVEEVDLFTQANEFKVPVYFLIGKYDYNTPWELSQKYFNSLKAPQKKYIWFEKSAHAPNFEEPEEFGNTLKSIKKDTFK